MKLAPYAFVFGAIITACSGNPSSSQTESNDSVGNTGASAAARHEPFSGTFIAVGTGGNTLGVPYSRYDFSTDGTYKASRGESTGHGTYAITACKADCFGLRDQITFTGSDGNTKTYLESKYSNTLNFFINQNQNTAYFYLKDYKGEISSGAVCQDDAGNSLGECADSGNFGCEQSGFSGGASTCEPLDAAPSGPGGSDGGAPTSTDAGSPTSESDGGSSDDGGGSTPSDTDGGSLDTDASAP
jgi:hypothetical protein